MQKFRMVLLLLLMVVAVGGHRKYARNHDQSINVIPLPFIADAPSARRAGALTFLGGWELKSPNSDFGGVSAMVALANNRFLAVSDAGILIGFTFDGKSRLADSFIADLPGAYGKDRDYEDRDSEGMAYDPASRRIWISYEAHHAIRRFPPSLNRIDGVRRLTFTGDWSDNGGIETFVRLADGRFVIISETHMRADDANTAYLYSGDPVEPGTQIMPFGYRAPKGYRPTDAALLPDGRVLVLNRRIGFPQGFTAKLVLIDPKDISRNAMIKPKLLATLAPPMLVDNMEALAVTQEKDQTIVWMASDDNFNTIQRTLLMKFVLRLPNKKPEAETTPGFETLSR